MNPWRRPVMCLMLATTALCGVLLLSKLDGGAVQQDVLGDQANVSQRIELPANTPLQMPIYEIGVWQGCVAVFVPGEEAPRQILETPVEALPQPDQAALQTRIPIMDEQQLASVLEDYGS